MFASDKISRFFASVIEILWNCFSFTGVVVILRGSKHVIGSKRWWSLVLAN